MLKKEITPRLWSLGLMNWLFVCRFDMPVEVVVLQLADSSGTDRNKRQSLLLFNSGLTSLCPLCISSLPPAGDSGINRAQLKLSFLSVSLLARPQSVRVSTRAKLNMLFCKRSCLRGPVPGSWCDALINNYCLLIYTDWLPSRTEVDVSGVFLFFPFAVQFVIDWELMSLRGVASST